MLLLVLLSDSCHRVCLNPGPKVRKGKGRGEGSSTPTGGRAGAEVRAAAHPPGDGHAGGASAALLGLGSACRLSAPSSSTGEAWREEHSME